PAEASLKRGHPIDRAGRDAIQLAAEIFRQGSPFRILLRSRKSEIVITKLQDKTVVLRRIFLLEERIVQATRSRSGACIEIVHVSPELMGRPIQGIKAVVGSRARKNIVARQVIPSDRF